MDAKIKIEKKTKKKEYTPGLPSWPGIPATPEIIRINKWLTCMSKSKKLKL